ncbi:diguanylate cyclase [Thioalkalivibrio sp. ALJ16]|uniref:GGDEF domain-containing protein n=1 Tax=Thioalkalivibrio sp. ALJ16 TaxID=1158762 RepID=UPI000370B0BC|nr:diguanylate cyclase [Thioalkalivibrio sp. ALJ16]
MTHPSTEAVRSTVHAYLDVWLRQRDLAAMLRFHASAVSGFGTGADEVAFTPEEVERIVGRDIEQVPEPFDYAIRREEIRLLTDRVALVMLIFDMILDTRGQRVRLNGLRASLVLHGTAGGWRLEHLHGSFPTSIHGEDEAYPVKELEARAEVLERLVRERTHSLEAAQQRLEHLATTDPLTGLNNRMKANEALADEILRAERHATPLSVILLDLDHFKPINDTLGHGHGDSVLTAVGRLITARIRATDRAARWGGEEFLILCPQDGIAATGQLAEDLRRSIEAHDFQIGQPLTASFGVAQLEPGESAESLVDRADRALYAAKHAGRNRVQGA